MAIPSGFAARREVRAKGALPDTIQPWAMVDPLLGTVLEIRVPARLYTRRRGSAAIQIRIFQHANLQTRWLDRNRGE